MFSSSNTPKNLIDLSLLTVNPFILKFGRTKGMFMFCLSLWKNVYLVLLTFNDNLLALNQLLSLHNSLFTVSNKILMLE